LAAIEGTVRCDGLQDVFEGHAMVGLLPHLLGQIEMALGGVDVGVDAEGERLVDQQLVRVEVAHQMGECVAFLLGHPGEVAEILAQLHLIGEPGVGNGLVVQLVRPRVADRFEQ
jgi:hypothetical protein